MSVKKPTIAGIKKMLRVKRLKCLGTKQFWQQLPGKIWAKKNSKGPKFALPVLLIVGIIIWKFLLVHAITAPYNAVQYGADHQAQIATGAYTSDSNIYLDANVGDAASLTDVFTPKAELRNTGTAFSNTVTHTGPDVQYDSNIPDKRRGTDMVYDSVNKQLVVFGGFGGDTGTKVNLNDVWVLSLTKGLRSQWKKLTPTGTPPTARRALQLIYDTANSRVILYGGYNGTTSDGTVYALSMTPGSEAWSTVTTAGTGPTLRVQHTTIYDAANQRMMVYAGRNDGGTATSLTLFQLTLPTTGTPTWSQPTVSGAPATGREATATIYDPINQVMWMHGGCSGSNPGTCTRVSDIWKLTLPSTGTLVWTQTNASCGPFSAGTEGINGHAMGYDAANQQAVMYGGKAVSYQATVYSFNLPSSGAATCTDHSSEPIVSGTNFDGTRPFPTGLGSPKGVYDPDSKRMIFMFGYDNTTYANETWVFDNLADSSKWEYKVMAPIVYKRARDGNMMMYDSTNSMIYEFGGAGRYTPADSLHIPETWRLTTSGALYWADAGADTAPFNREFGNFIYDTANQRGIYCYGLQHAWVVGDCWQMTIRGGATGRVSWSLLPISNTLPGQSSNRWGPASVYDSANNRMITFGGVNNNNTVTALNDVQVLNLPTGGATAYWSTPAITGTAPTARQLLGYVYDPVNQRMLAFGGETGAGATNNQVWELTLPASGNFTWRLLTPTGTPPSARSRMAMVYDPNSGNPRIVTFGGYDGTNVLNDVWQLTIPASGDGAWSQPTVTGTPPSARRSMGSVLDPVNNRMIISMGRDNTNFFAETYALNLGASMSWTQLVADKTVPVSVPISGISAQKYHWQIWATGSVTGDIPKTAFGGNSDTVTAATDFSTTPLPSVSSISPASGPAAGSTPFTITGSGFVNGATVSIGGNAATNVFTVSSGIITGLAPPGISGGQNVIVTNPLGDTSTLSSAFTYVNTPYGQQTKTITTDFTAAGATLTNLSTSGIKIDEGVFQWQDSTPSTSGGSIGAGTYYYAVTATDFGGGETTRSVESRGVVTTGSTSSVNLKWRPVPGATGYKVYRTTSSGTYSSPALLTTISAVNSSTLLTQISYTDTAAAASSGAPPGSNTTNGELQMNRGTVPATGAGTFTAGPAIVGTTSGDAFTGSHSIQRPDGKFLIIIAGTTSNTSIYDPIANTFTAGPSIVGTVGNNASSGSHSIQRPDGKFLIILAGATSNTSIYDPVANTFIAGPAITGTVGGAGHSIQLPDGKFLTVLGNANTSIYDPIANTFSAGPAIVGTAGITAGIGTHSIQRPDGKFLVILGGATSSTSIYDPVANTFIAGPAIVGTAGNTASFGSHSVQRPDGKFLVMQGTTSNTSIYDPVANTFTAGPMGGAAYSGGHSIQRPDGKFLVMLAGATPSTTIYDAGWLTGATTQNGTLGAYISEDLEASGSVKNIGWVKTLDDYIQASDGTDGKIELKVAKSQIGLANAAYANYSNGQVLPSGNRWYKIKVTFRRVVPGWRRADHSGSDLWLGSGSTFENRAFAIPDLQSLTVTFDNTLPGAPTLKSPANSATGIATNPELRLFAVEPDGDLLRYKIEVCSTSNCSVIVRTIDQTISQTGWLAQSRTNATGYDSGQEAVHKYQDPPLSPTTQYWWRAYAIDPNGTNTFSTASAIGTFTTGAVSQTNVKVQGGTTIRGGTRFGN